MRDLYWLTDEQMARLKPYSPRATARPEWMTIGVERDSFRLPQFGLRWRDAPVA